MKKNDAILIEGSDQAQRQAYIDAIADAIGATPTKCKNGGDFKHRAEHKPLIDHKRLFIVEVDQIITELSAKELEAYIEKVDAVAFYAETIDKRTTIYRVLKDNLVKTSDTQDMGEHIASKTWLPQADATQLAISLGGNLGKINNAIEQIKYLDNKDEVKLAIVADPTEADIWEIVKHIIDGNRSHAIGQTVRYLKAGNHPVTIVHPLYSSIRAILVAKNSQHKTAEEMAEDSNMNPYQARMAKQRIQEPAIIRLPDQVVAKMLTITQRYEADIKNGRLQGTHAIYSLIIELDQMIIQYTGGVA